MQFLKQRPSLSVFVFLQILDILTTLIGLRLGAGESSAFISRLAGLPTWDRPASACLSSRIPYGTPVTIQTVKTVEVGEEEIKALGFRQFRVRFHGEMVRIEIAKDELARALTPEMAAKFTSIFKTLGFKYVALDLEGYRQGSLNEVLNLRQNAPAS